MSCSRGLSLLEIIITLAVLAILMTIAAVNSRGLEDPLGSAASQLEAS